jgi:glutamate synthase domain-containing protein 2/glutamate synthase domain-containing protein 1/glutamate synthase domain-containing protein 3
MAIAPDHDACGIGFVADSQGRASRELTDRALGGLRCVKHRGALAADARSGDGCGILLPIAPALFGEGVGVAVLFVRGDDPTAAVEAAARQEGLHPLGWRAPEVDIDVLGELARRTKPDIRQFLFAAAEGRADDRVALRLRRRIEAATADTYVASCSFRTVVYKALAPSDRLADFYADLRDPRLEVAFAIFHQRFSTNTLPTWERAQPFRMLCHNGEINAIGGNENRMQARAVLGTEECGLGPEELFRPVVDAAASDSGKLDAAVELLTRAGRDIRHVMAMLIPDAWENVCDMDPAVRGFYEYHSALVEPWDGPAGLVFTDGIGVGACLDRNGLRPLRWSVSENGLVVCCSEAGAVDLSGTGMVRRGRLGPGQMIFVDPTRGVQLEDELKDRLAAAGPYARWASIGLRRLGPGKAVVEVPEVEDLVRLQAMHGYTKEDLAMVVRPMYTDGKEPVFSMGDDSPLPPMAGRARPVHHFFKQRFAQVTNPPIDPLREGFVMSLRTLLGPRAPLLTETPEASRLLELDTFFVYPTTVDELFDDRTNPFPIARLDGTFDLRSGPAGLRTAVERLGDEASRAVTEGVGILVIDDGDAGPDRVPVPSLLATGAVHHRLIADRLRSEAALVVVSDTARDVHEFACLLGYGADAICPRLALWTVAHEVDAAEDAGLLAPEAQDRFQAAVEAGVLKIISKMGISTIDSYRGAQIFEVIGLADEVVDRCFTGTVSTVGGLGWAELGQDCLDRHALADLESPGYYRVRANGEYHGKGKDVVDALNELSLVKEPARPRARGGDRIPRHLRSGGSGRVTDPDPRVSERALADMTAAHLLQRAIAGESYDRYEHFSEIVNARPATELQDLLEIGPAGPAVPLDEVEPAREITRRFSTGAMSHGALSREAHETLAQAMNLVGGMANCGEGGEDPYRFRTRGQGRDDRNSRIKQIASGRFGVTPEYVAHADELNIKMAQGSKPGEGGQLPGHKVSDEIARLRHTQPGVALISPPPHHDIYSIEDLAQLVYDLKQVNAAEVSVKLVAEDGVGTVAAGCVKALADVVQISGHNGGTGASPLSSIKHAGMPWELGLVDAQHRLIENGLRSRVRLRVDGGFMTGRHVVVAALLGADEYSFGTAAMIAEGCIMLRACHRDTCKPGVATQRPHLRANFAGTPEGVAAYFLFLAEEVRSLLAGLGMRSVDEAIGRVDLLTQRVSGDPRVDSVDLSVLLEPLPGGPDEPRRFIEHVELQRPRSPLGDQLLSDAFRSLWDGDDVDLAYTIRNSDRTVGAALGGAIALEFGQHSPRGTARVHFTGQAGQSFAAFLTQGIEFTLRGEANDYVGKGMGGGLVVVRAPADDMSRHGDTGAPPALVGNTCLYGATGGELFAAGTAGERFAVRNSGATAVIEGTGEHCGEYMTGGTVVVLGDVGYNLGAGMTGGEIFVWTSQGSDELLPRINLDLVEVVRPEVEDLEQARWLIERHRDLTGSERSTSLVENWDRTVNQLWHVVPKQRAAQMRRLAAERVGSSV